MTLTEATCIYLEALRAVALETLGHGDFKLQLDVSLGTRPEDRDKINALQQKIQTAMTHQEKRTSLQ